MQNVSIATFFFPFLTNTILTLERRSSNETACKYEICFLWVLCITFVLLWCAYCLWVWSRFLIFLSLLLQSNLPLYFCHLFTFFHSHGTLSFPTRKLTLEGCSSFATLLWLSFSPSISSRTFQHHTCTCVWSCRCDLRYLHFSTFTRVHMYEIHSKHFCWLYRGKCVVKSFENKLKINYACVCLSRGIVGKRKECRERCTETFERSFFHPRFLYCLLRCIVRSVCLTSNSLHPRCYLTFSHLSLSLLLFFKLRHVHNFPKYTKQLHPISWSMALSFFSAQI